MILDAGCGNRMMWMLKNSEHIIYGDVEKQLQRKPTIFMDNQQMPFKSNSFDTVFYDPPHAWGFESNIFSSPNIDIARKKNPKMYENVNRVPTYYGIEKYKTRSALVAYIYRTEKELYRVLKSDGCLWLRWSHLKEMDTDRILGIFSNWECCTKHELDSPQQTRSECKSLWLMLMKKPMVYIQPDLFTVSQNPLLLLAKTEGDMP